MRSKAMCISWKDFPNNEKWLVLNYPKGKWYYVLQIN